MNRPLIAPSRRRRTHIWIAISASVLQFGCGGDSDSEQATIAATQLTCDDSIKANFKPDSDTTVLSVRKVKKGDPIPTFFSVKTAPVSADLCLVKLLVGPGNPGPVGAPSTSAGIGIEVWLPEKSVWTGRLQSVGNGGWGGSSESDPVVLSTGSSGVDNRTAAQLAGDEGDVTSNSDLGHRWHLPETLGFMASIDGSWVMNPDGTPATNLWKDYSYRAAHEQTAKARALATAYYGSAPKFTYWNGLSVGGRTGLKQAQMYPDDYDGIVVMVPVINWSKTSNAGIYGALVVQRDLGGVTPTAAQQLLVHTATIAACDSHGGQHLGFVLDPPSCRYDPTKDSAVLCVSDGGTNATASCVTTLQATAFNKAWYGATSDGSVPDPAVDNGWEAPTGLHRWYGYPRGSLPPFTTSSLPTSQLAAELQNPFYGSPSFTNATGNGADGWKFLSYAAFSNAFDRGVALQPVFGDVDSDNPDLSKFKASGGKLIHVGGYADTSRAPAGAVNYYDRVVQSLGGVPAVQSFYRLTVVPGMGHGAGNGTGIAAANPPIPAVGQYLKLIENWVEKGVAPDNVVHVSPSAVPVAKSLPVCFYPQKVTYVSGDVNVASSFKCS